MGFFDVFEDRHDRPHAPRSIIILVLLSLVCAALILLFTRPASPPTAPDPPVHSESGK